MGSIAAAGRSGRRPRRRRDRRRTPTRRRRGRGRGQSGPTGLTDTPRSAARRGVRSWTSARTSSQAARSSTSWRRRAEPVADLRRHRGSPPERFASRDEVAGEDEHLGVLGRVRRTALSHRPAVVDTDILEQEDELLCALVPERFEGARVAGGTLDGACRWAPRSRPRPGSAGRRPAPEELRPHRPRWANERPRGEQCDGDREPRARCGASLRGRRRASSGSLQLEPAGSIDPSKWTRQADRRRIGRRARLREIAAPSREGRSE